MPDGSGKANRRMRPRALSSTAATSCPLPSQRGLPGSWRTGNVKRFAVFDDAKGEFVHTADAPLTAAAGAISHTVRHTDGGVEYVYFAHPYPLTRVRATPADFLNPAAYESFTCLAGGSTPSGGST